VAGEWIGRDPPRAWIDAMCCAFQQSWTADERARRSGKIAVDDNTWSVPQFLVHHCETGQWQKGRERKVQVWRCVDGR
jgi:hypothetical protein